MCVGKIFKPCVQIVVSGLISAGWPCCRLELKNTDEDFHTLLGNSINRNCWLLSSVSMATPEWSSLGTGSCGNQFGCIYLVADIARSSIWTCVRFLQGCLYSHCNCLALFCRWHPTINLGCCRCNSNPDWGSDHRLSTTLINFCLSIVESGLVSAGLSCSWLDVEIWCRFTRQWVIPMKNQI